jgi:hypothetical protein
MPHTTIVFSRDRQNSSWCQSLQADLLARLARRPDVDVTVILYLYDLTPSAPAIERLLAIDGDLIVLAPLYPRATYWLLRADGIPGRRGQPPETADARLGVVDRG